MQIAVEIDDNLYNRIKHLEPRSNTMLDELMRSVQNGTPLPKGYGRLVDISPYEKKDKNAEPWELRRYVGNVVKEPEIVKLSDLPTIIEAYKEDENADSN